MVWTTFGLHVHPTYEKPVATMIHKLLKLILIHSTWDTWWRVVITMPGKAENSDYS